MRSGTTAKAFVFPEGSAAPKGLLYDEIRNKLLGYFNALALHV